MKSYCYHLLPNSEADKANDVTTKRVDHSPQCLQLGSLRCLNTNKTTASGERMGARLVTPDTYNGTCVGHGILCEVLFVWLFAWVFDFKNWYFVLSPLSWLWIWLAFISLGLVGFCFSFSVHLFLFILFIDVTSCSFVLPLRLFGLVQSAQIWFNLIWHASHRLRKSAGGCVPWKYFTHQRLLKRARFTLCGKSASGIL